MGWPSLMVFVRHGQSSRNVLDEGNDSEKRKVSTHRISLTKKGEQQARITRQYLDKRFGAFDAYLSSYYLRAKATLQLMYPGARLYETAMLAEVQTGIWDTMSVEEVQAAYPREIARKELEGWYHYRPIGGESFLDVESRVINFLVILQTYFARKRVLVITHGNWFGMFKKFMHLLSVEGSFEILRKGFENCSVTSYEPEVSGSAVRIKLVDDCVVPWEGKL